MAKDRETASGAGESLWQFVDRTAKEVAELPAWVKGGNTSQNSNTSVKTSTSTNPPKLEV